MNNIKTVEENIKKILNHWGFGEICSSIYAVLSLSDKPLTARELSRKIGYAYTTTINALNHSIGLGHIRKMRKDGSNVYYIDADISDIVKEELIKFVKVLEDTKKSIHTLDEKYRLRLKGLLKTINNSIQFLKKSLEVG
ncbi:MAG: hypothetical protein J7K87_01610 [Candidatus Aenigmarchaeota archaeon]|nr:hypothetical protein [Candidatus Aenigmarchaeota archaeon]